MRHPYHIQALYHCIWAWAWASWLTCSRPLWCSRSPTRNSTYTSVFPTRHPLGRHSLGRVSFFWLHCHPLQRENKITLPVVHLIIITARGPMSAPQKLRYGLNSALLGATKTHLNCFWRLDPGSVLNKEGRNLPALSAPPGQPLVWFGTLTGSLKNTKDLASSDSESSRGNVDDSDMDRAAKDYLSCSGTDEVSVWTACKKY